MEGSLPDTVPDAVRDVWEHFGSLHIPSELDPETKAVYEAGARGECMLCRQPVGEEAIIKVNVVGINQLFCSHKCDQDIQVMGYLMQSYDDIKEGVEFRAGEVH